MITGYVGLIGQGKTMLAVDDSIAMARRRGALLASNIRIVSHGVPFVQLLVGDDGLDLDQIRVLVDRCKREGRGLVLLIDEVGIIMPARFWQSFPIGLMFMLSQSRKLALDLVWTSQDVEQVDSFLRRLTQWVYKVRSVPSPSIERREKGRRPWFIVRDKYRPAHVTGAQHDKRLGRDWLRYRRSRELQYDTDELVMPPARLARRNRGGGRAPGSSPEVQEIDGPGSDRVTRRAQAQRSDGVAVDAGGFRAGFSPGEPIAPGRGPRVAGWAGPNGDRRAAVTEATTVRSEPSRPQGGVALGGHSIPSTPG